MKQVSKFALRIHTCDFTENIYTKLEGKKLKLFLLCSVF